MRTSSPTRLLFALFMCTTAALSAITASGIAVTSVFGDGDVSVQLKPALTSMEPSNASGNVRVNTQTGQMELELAHATPSSVYTVLFVSAGGNITLGTLTTDMAGHGALHGSLVAGVFVGMFQILRSTLVQFTSDSVTITIGTSASSSVTDESSQTTMASSNSTSFSNESETTTVGLNNTLRTEFHVDPESRSTTAGGYASYNINILQQGSANVFLATRGVPPESVAIFSQDSGLAAPEFHSTLAIVTSTGTPADTYTIVVVAILDGQENDVQVTLTVTTSSTTIRTSNTINFTAEKTLALALHTDQHRYGQNSTVTIQGYVTDNSGNVVANANADVQVDGPTGLEVSALGGLQTDAVGMFYASFKLPFKTQTGTYTVFASATKQGYASATTRTTFVVESSSTPSVVIQSVYTGDSAGNPITVFSQGQTVYVWVVVENIGSTFQGVIWIQILDPGGLPVQVLIRISSLASGETFRDGFGFTLLGNPTPGLYTVNALVSNNLISRGGVFLASGNVQFAVTSS